MWIYGSGITNLKVMPSDWLVTSQIEAKYPGLATVIVRISSSLYQGANNSAYLLIHLMELSTLSIYLQSKEMSCFDEVRLSLDCPRGQPCSADWLKIHIFILMDPVQSYNYSSVGEWMCLTVCPLYALGHDSSVGEWMCLTVCPLYALGHDSSVGEWMYLSVLPVAWAMIAQSKNECVSLGDYMDIA